jgi:hypothetical protein
MRSVSYQRKVYYLFFTYLLVPSNFLYFLYEYFSSCYLSFIILFIIIYYLLFYYYFHFSISWHILACSLSSPPYSLLFLFSSARQLSCCSVRILAAELCTADYDKQQDCAVQALAAGNLQNGILLQPFHQPCTKECCPFSHHVINICF